MRYFEVLIADGRYHGDLPLTYSFDTQLKPFNIVTVPLRQRLVSGFVFKEVKKPDFPIKSIKNLLSDQPLPTHCLDLARWLSSYYSSSLGEALRQFAPARAAVKTAPAYKLKSWDLQADLEAKLAPDQQKALAQIAKNKSQTILLHGETASGKTRIYLELAKQTLKKGKGVLLLTPEISLTAQLVDNVKKQLSGPVIVVHSQLSVAERQKLWLAILEAKEPVTVVGPRSALFYPVSNLGLIVLDEAHEPAYKQDQSPYYSALRVASYLGNLCQAKVVLGSATPQVNDYYLAKQNKAVIKMGRLARATNPVATDVIDLKSRQNFTKHPHLSNQLIDAINATLSAKKQIMLYLNRRGSARIILCNSCGWQASCPNCDVGLVYHADEHRIRCHICGHNETLPIACPKCRNPDVLYKSVGTKAIADDLSRLFPQSHISRFDSDNVRGERLNELFDEIRSGSIDILVGTQLLAKGLDLPKLSLVGILSAETSLSLPDYTAEERAFQLLYQVMGRVGRGHGQGQIIIQSYQPESLVIKAAVNRDFELFYQKTLATRQQFRFPPYSYLLQLTCKRSSAAAAKAAAGKLKTNLSALNLPVEIVGPTPSFYGRRGMKYYYQLVVKSKNRGDLLKLAQATPPDWRVNLDPIDLL
ncbi:MAG: primosomal protein N' [Candidatus Saccharimonadales bacterium]